jgi:hypothetical protein
MHNTHHINSHTDATIPPAAAAAAAAAALPLL